MLAFVFEIITPPGAGYRIATDTSGPLTVLIDDEPFLTIQDCLLVEFAIDAGRWLSWPASENLPFHYASMDEEEAPLLAFIPDGVGGFAPSSCWSEKTARHVDRDEIVTAVSTYRTRLDQALRDTFEVALPDF